MGIDRIFVDESDLYKNLGFTTKMKRIAGLPNTESNRALDMYMKTRYLAERNGGIVFATGTPISNTMAEMYTLQRYLAPETLKAAGVEHFDAWAANFGEAVTALELAPDGSGYRMHTRFAKFVNLPELLSMFRSFADVQTADMLHLPRPEIEGGKPHITAAPGFAGTEGLCRHARGARAEAPQQSKIDPSVDNMLKITGDGRKAALDMRLVDPFGGNHRAIRRFSRAIDKIYQTWAAGKDKRLTQLVFCDLSTPNPDRFNVYDEIRDKLIAKGIPAKEIAYIHDADTDAQKKALFDAVNAGRVRILLGSTEKMGAGTNVQKRLIALHHLDAPWRPRDIEQREGRILRQGNDNPEIQIHRYVTEGSFDAYMWQMLGNESPVHQSGHERQRHRPPGRRPRRRRAHLCRDQGHRLGQSRRDGKGQGRYRNPQARPAALLPYQPAAQYPLAGEKPARADRTCPRNTMPQSPPISLTRDAHAEDEFTMTGRQPDILRQGRARGRSRKALNAVIMSWRDDKTLKVPRPLQRLRDPEPRQHTSRTATLIFSSAAKRPIKPISIPTIPLGTIQSIEHVLRSLDRRAEDEQREIERQEKALADYKAQLGRPFEHEERLKDLLAKQAQLNAALDLDKHDVQTVDDAREPGGKEPVASFAARIMAENRQSAAMTQ